MKQIKLHFITDNEVLPVQYNSFLLSFIKARIQDCSPELFESWFTKTDNFRKSYTFSCYFPSSYFSSGQLFLPQKEFFLSFSTYDQRDFIIFYNSFLAFLKKTSPLPSNSYMLDSISTPDLKNIMGRSLTIRMESPLLVRYHDRQTNIDRFLPWNDPNFADNVKTIIAYTAQIQKIDIDVSDFCITPIQAKKTVIAHFGLKVNANLGIYRLDGNPALLNYLYRGGMGSATGSGHGKFNILSSY